MKKWAGLFATIILSIFALKPLFGNGYFPMHDDTQVARVIVMGKALRQGQFPVRWVSDLGYGYGYPIYNFYGPLPYYIGGSLYALGVDSVTATKSMFALGILASSVFFYLLASSLFDPLLAVVGAILFVYAPYHAVQIYVRGAVGEYWAVSFVPLLLLGILAPGKSRHRYTYTVLGAAGLAVVILSHTILGFVTTGLTAAGILLYSAIQSMRKQVDTAVLTRIILIILTGLGLSAFFWAPAFVEMNKTGVSAMISGAPTTFFDHFVCVGQLWDSPWGYGGSAPGCTDGMSFKLGKLQLILTLIGIVTWIIVKKKKKKIPETSGFMGLGVALFIISTGLVLGITKPVWAMVPFVSFIQYPWRLLTFSTLAMAMCGLYTITYFRNSITRFGISAAIILICLFMNIKLFAPQYSFASNPGSYESQEDLRYRVSKISDEYLPAGIPKPRNPNDFIRMPLDSNPDLSVHVMRQTDTYLSADLDARAAQTVLIKKAYFPGWEYLLNGKTVKPTIARGLPSVLVLEGTSVLEARFTNTPIRLLGNILSMVSLIGCAVALIYVKKTIT